MVQLKRGILSLLSARLVMELNFSDRTDIMAATSNHLEQAFDKISRYCSFEFRQMGKDAQTEVGPTMQQAVKRLQQRPELLKCVSTFASL